MLIASFVSEQQMAAANFTLALCFVFTFALPILLVTRSNKTESNRSFLIGTLNPWHELETANSLQIPLGTSLPTLEDQTNSEGLVSNVIEISNRITKDDEGVTALTDDGALVEDDDSLTENLPEKELTSIAA